MLVQTPVLEAYEGPAIVRVALDGKVRRVRGPGGLSGYVFFMGDGSWMSRAGMVSGVVSGVVSEVLSVLLSRMVSGADL